jgi:hypothetical protein
MEIFYLYVRIYKPFEDQDYNAKVTMVSIIIRNLLTCLPIYIYSIVIVNLEIKKKTKQDDGSLGIIGIEDFDVGMKS